MFPDLTGRPYLIISAGNSCIVLSNTSVSFCKYNQYSYECPPHFIHKTFTLNYSHLKLFFFPSHNYLHVFHINFVMFLPISSCRLQNNHGQWFKQKPVHNGQAVCLFQVLLSVKLNFSPPSKHRTINTTTNYLPFM